jgi:hypothetical protein
MGKHARELVAKHGAAARLERHHRQPRLDLAAQRVEQLA